MTIRTRPAKASDAGGMSLVLGEIIRMWKSDRAFDPEHVRAHYIQDPDKVACTVAVNDAGEVFGFQSLKLARAGNQYDVTPGWGIIGSYVRTAEAGKGIGRLLFNASRAAGQLAGLPAIDATIGAGNKSGLTYYAAIGFRTYLTTPDRIRKRFDLD